METTIGLKILAFATVGGLGPVLLWLWFWLKEDSIKPEPAWMLFLTFLGGAFAVAIVLPVEQFIARFVTDPLPFFTSLAFVEEFAKYAIVALIAFKTRFIDEPSDFAIYLITGALGFSAAENILYLIDPIRDNDIILTLLTGNLRFLGATILHAVASSIIGLSLGLAFYKSRSSRIIHGIIGLIIAVGLHTVFNFFIIGSQEHIFPVLGGLWVTVIFVLLLFERVKTIESDLLITS